MAAGLPIRIKAGATAPYTDSNGNVWLPDQGFVDGDVIDRGSDMQIANTQDQAIYRTERYGMSSFSYKLPNGKYIVKLHFAETYEDITGPGQRVFSLNVAGHEFKDFDVWAKTGGARRAYIETVNVDITDGKLDIAFTTNIQSPEINGIEIIPGSLPANFSVHSWVADHLAPEFFQDRVSAKFSHAPHERSCLAPNDSKLDGRDGFL